MTYFCYGFQIYVLGNNLYSNYREVFLGFIKPLFFFFAFIATSYNFIISAQELTSADNTAAVQAGKKLFNANCAACHKLNKRAVGPALKGVSGKYDREWLYSWIKNSTAMVKSGDPQAIAIYEEYNGSVMTSFPQLSNSDIDNILATPIMFLRHQLLLQVTQRHQYLSAHHQI